MTLTCAIIDDEPLAISLLESYVNKTPFLRLAGKFNSALEALPVLSAQPVELLFLDIQMPELSGMEFSRILKTDTRIIFTTAFEQYALDSYKVNALDYLLKPIAYPDFLKAANKALQWYEHMQAPATEIESIFIYPFIDEHEVVGRNAADEPLYTCASFFYRTAGKDQGDRTKPDCVRKRIHPDLRQLQTEAYRIFGATITQFQLTTDIYKMIRHSPIVRCQLKSCNRSFSKAPVIRFIGQE